jgi:hypothetical protein
MGIIENSHRADDEYFLMVHAERCKTKEEFIQRADVKIKLCLVYYKLTRRISSNG